MRRAPVRKLFLAFVGATVVLVAAAAWGVYTFNAPQSWGGGGGREAQEAQEAQEVIVYLTRGMALANVARTLHRAGALEHPGLFEWGVRLSGAERRLKAGEYALSADLSPREVMNVLIGGKTLLHSVTVPEGLTTAEILAVLRAEDRLSGELPSEVPEGRLLPETYNYQRHDPRAGLVRRMRQAMADTVDRLWPLRQSGLPFSSPLEALVLASMVEKETAVPEERARIAGVFVNRLRLRMRLQSDPTVVYALTGGAGPLGRPLTLDDLRVDSPFNTYRIDGLPPRPIANPGRAAIEAALQPADTDALYFVADGSGRHVFSKSLQEHGENVRRWRALKARRRAAR